MTFEHWWASLTNAEKKILTENYARYIWNTAQAAVQCKCACAPEREDKFNEQKITKAL